ncbi:hypothetical protein B0E37_01682 [Streptomyces sp. MH192]|nr:hypothetical protein [Streptomyces sp. MH192]MCF0098779.1 hypothetical protein [Streptomyces sp. MH191]
MKGRVWAVSAAAAAVVVAGSVVGLVWAGRREAELRRVLARERAELRVTDGCLWRDTAVLRSRLAEAVAGRREAERVLAEAGVVVGRSWDVGLLHEESAPRSGSRGSEGGPV